MNTILLSLDLSFFRFFMNVRWCIKKVKWTVLIFQVPFLNLKKKFIIFHHQNNNMKSWISFNFITLKGNDLK